MRTRRRSGREAFRAEVWFEERSGTIEIARTDAGYPRQRLSCTFEQWEQIKRAVDHLFLSPEAARDGWEALQDVSFSSPN